MARLKKEISATEFPEATEHTAFAHQVKVGEVVRIWGMPAMYRLLRRQGDQAVFASTWMPDPPEFRVGPKAFVERVERSPAAQADNGGAVAVAALEEARQALPEREFKRLYTANPVEEPNEDEEDDTEEAYVDD